MGKHFAAQTGMIPLPDPSVVTLYGKKYLLMHGDFLCTDDKRHQRYICIVRHPIVKKCSKLYR